MDVGLLDGEDKDAPRGLTWALTIVTYNRQQVLPRAVRCAVTQSTPPKEVVIVDASDDWEQTRDAVQSMLNQLGSEAALIYQPADVRGICPQRNQAIDSTSADILFLIDDDSLMYPGCAQEILNIYEHKLAENIMGVCASLSTQVPKQGGPNPFADDPEPVNTKLEKGNVVRNRTTGLRGRITKWFLGEYLPHYLHPAPTFDIPAELRETFRLFPRKQVHGARMTFRRSIFAKERFDSVLGRYSCSEDFDFGYRVSRHGIVVTSPLAKLCHLGDLGGRISSFKHAVISITNAAYLVRKNSQDKDADLQLIRVQTMRRMVYVFIKDLARGHLRFPQARGAWLGLRHMRWICRVPDNELDSRYIAFQNNFFD